MAADPDHKGGDARDRTVFLVGIGAGDPEHLTLAAVRALNRTDAVFIVDKGETGAALHAARLELCRRVIDPAHPYRVVEVALDGVRDRDAGPYDDAIASWRDARAVAYEELIGGLSPGEAGAFLAWGDPTLYDGTLAILDDVRSRSRVEFAVEVVSGISSIASLAARHRIALNRAGESILVTTGRRLARDGVPDGVDNIVVMLDAHDAWQTLDDDFDVWWGAFIGLPDELIASGRLGDERERIVRLRSEARNRNGWLFDTFLFRRTAR
jgi:precorrin-6A synthase